MSELIKAEDYGIEKAKEKELIGNLPQIIEERSELVKQFKEVIKLDLDDPKTAKTAKTLRLLIANNRTKKINVWHKTGKDFFLRGGQFFDAIKNKEIAVNQMMEADLSNMEKHAEIKEAARIEELSETRLIEITPFLHPEAEQPINLGQMQDDIWNNYLAGAKANYNTRIEAEKESERLRIEAEEKAEKERKETERLINLKNERTDSLKPYFQFVPDSIPSLETLSDDEWNDFFEEMKSAKETYDKEQAKIKAENERLKKEAELKAKQEETERLERERLAKIESDKQAKIKADLETKAAKEKAAKEKAAKEAQAKQDELNRKLKEEREAAAKFKAEQEAKEKAAKLAEAARIEAELKKGDADKLQDLINDLNALKTKYSFKSTTNKQKYIDTGALIDKVVGHIKK